MISPYHIIFLIAGCEIKDDKSSLLVFDPMAYGETLKRNLMSGNSWQRLVKRGSHTLTQDAYQLVYVLPELLTSEQWESSKVIFTEPPLSFQSRYFV